MFKRENLPAEASIFAVLIGTLIGTHLGIKKLNQSAVKKTLGIVIIIAGLKFIFT